MAVLIRTIEEDSYYLFREKFLRVELEFAKVAANPHWLLAKRRRPELMSNLPPAVHAAGGGLYPLGSLGQSAGSFILG